MVDDEAAGGTEAAGFEVGAVAVAGEDEKVGAFCGGHDFSFDAARAFLPGARASQLLGRTGQELFGKGGGQVFHGGAGARSGRARPSSPA